MKKITQSEFDKILKDHKKWLSGDSRGVRACLSNCDFRNCDFHNCDLRNCDFHNCDFRNRDFRNCDFRNCDFRGNDLSGCDFRNCDLHNCDLRDNELSGSDFRNYDLRNCDLRGSGLRNYDLRNCDLTGSDLRGSDLRNCVGNRKEVKSLFVSEEYPITYTSTHICIGCENHEIAEWWGFDDERIAKMDGVKALEFWKKWKSVIKNVIEISPARGPGVKSVENKYEVET